ncbi:MAG: hypothetical protein QF441_01780 [Bacteriovoracaceae bacterium]|jgi:hypothetical protein|nr:hypothetical protein [Bacteriovoracaceae bacterium]
MKKSATTLLILSLIISSCGKEEKSPSPVTPKMVSKKAATQAYKNDYDGDFIPNDQDPMPFIANIPELNEVISLSRNSQPLAIAKRIENRKQSLLKILKAPKNTYSSLYVPSSLKNEFEITEKSTEHIKVKTKSGFSQVHFLLKDKNNKFLDIQTTKEKEEHVFVPNAAGSVSLQLELTNYKFSQAGQKITYKELQESVLKNCYRLVLSYHENYTEEYYISQKLTIAQALKELGKQQLLENFLQTQYELSQSDFSELASAKNYWLLSTEQGANIHYTPNKKQTAYLFNFKKKNFLTSKKLLKDFTFNNSKRTFSFLLKQASSIKTLIKAKRTFHKTRTQKYEYKIKNNGSGTDTWIDFCYFDVLTPYASWKILNQSELESLISVSLDDEEISFSQLSRMNFQNTLNKQITLTLKDKLNSQASKGLRPSLEEGCNQGKQKVVYKGKYVRLRHSIDNYNDELKLSLQFLSESFPEPHQQ